MCSGCGAGPLIEPALSMELDDAGFVRPVRRGPDSPDQKVRTSTFLASCPGRTVAIRRDPAAESSDPYLGAAVSVWKGHATDANMRHAGSSGGVLTALQKWMVDTSAADSVLTTRARPGDPRRSEPHLEQRSGSITDFAGSRYAPSATLRILDVTTGDRPVLTAKPCEISASRGLADSQTISEPPLLLSFFCAGVPSQHATSAVLSALGIEPSHPLHALRYRGNGWPGEFTATAAPDRASSTMSYDESWGRHLGPTVQSRCKLCPDGVGRAADIVAADFWDADDNGYPLFSEQDGVSAVIARTARGHELLMRARQAGVVALEPTTLAEIAKIQPLQVDRVRTLTGRRVGWALTGRKNVKVRGVGYRRHSVLHPLQTARYAVGAWRRSRSQLPR